MTIIKIHPINTNIYGVGVWCQGVGVGVSCRGVVSGSGCQGVRVGVGVWCQGVGGPIPATSIGGEGTIPPQLVLAMPPAFWP